MIPLTETHLHDLTPTERLVEEAAERGFVEEKELEAFADEHELAEEEIAALHVALDERDVTVRAVVRAEASPAPTGTLDPLQLFMDAAGRHKLLTAADEVMLAKRIETGDPAAKERMINSNLRRVVSVSLNQGLGSDSDSELGDLFADESSADPAEEAAEALRRQRVQRAVAELPERQRRIIELRLGFGGESASLETIGKELGLTRERVRQLETEALMRLQLELGDELASAA